MASGTESAGFVITTDFKVYFAYFGECDLKIEQRFFNSLLKVGIRVGAQPCFFIIIFRQ